MKHLKEFENEADVKVFVKPNVVLANDTGKVLYNVEPVKGVFIQHIDGTLYTTAQWAESGISNDLANGVAVCTAEASFVVGRYYANQKWSSDNSTLIDGVTTTEDSATALTDFAGRKNTEAILKTATSGAAYTCGNYIFPNGQKGYLPALGEACILFKNIRAVMSAWDQLGVYASGNTGYLHSSTQCDATRRWGYGGIGQAARGDKNGATHFYPITELW